MKCGAPSDTHKCRCVCVSLRECGRRGSEGARKRVSEGRGRSKGSGGKWAGGRIFADRCFRYPSSPLLGSTPTLPPLRETEDKLRAASKSAAAGGWRRRFVSSGEFRARDYAAKVTSLSRPYHVPVTSLSRPCHVLVTSHACEQIGRKPVLAQCVFCARTWEGCVCACLWFARVLRSAHGPGIPGPERSSQQTW